MTRYIPARLRRIVIQRAGNRCEYCRLSQMAQAATFHVDHGVPLAAGGQTTEDNLALACVSCSLRKSARQVAPNPETGDEVPVFHSRQHVWSEHFRGEGVRIVGLTATGRATSEALQMNRPIVLAIRAEEAAQGPHQPG